MTSNIPGNLTAPIFAFDVQSGGQFENENRVLILGHGLAAGDLAVGEIALCATRTDARNLAGAGSILEAMFIRHRQNAPVQEVWLGRVDEDGTAEIRSITVGDVPAAGGQGVLMIAGRRIAITIAAGTSANALATALAAAINAYYDRFSEKKLELFNSQLKILQNNLKNTSIALGDQVLPGATGLMKGINDATSRDSAVRKALNERGMGFLEGEYYRFRNPGQVNRLAYEGGYREKDFLNEYWAERYTSGDVKSSTGRQGVSVVVGDFPGGGGGGVPVPNWRPGEGTSMPLADQYRHYGRGRQASEKARDPYSIGTAGGMTDNAFEQFQARAGAGASRNGGLSVPSGADWKEALKIDAGITGLKQSGEEAGQSVADGGKKAKDAIGEGAALIKVAGVDVGAAITNAAEQLLQAAREIARAKGAAFAMPSGGGRVNADTGRSMPASASQPWGGEKT